MSAGDKRLQPTDFLLRLDCAHATPASYRVEVQCAERGGTPARPIWRRQYPRQVLAIPSIDTWTLETLRQFIREVDAFLPAHSAADAVAIVTLREWKTGSQKLRVTVSTGSSRAELSLNDFDHCDREPLENGCSGIGEAFSVPMLDVLRRLHDRALTVAAFDVPPLHQTVQECGAVQPDTDGDNAGVESAIQILRQLATHEPDLGSSVARFIHRLGEGLL